MSETKIDIKYYAELAKNAFLNDPLYISCIKNESKRADFIFRVFTLRLALSQKYDEFIFDDKQRGLCIIHDNQKEYTALSYLKCKYAYSLLFLYPSAAIKLMTFSSGLKAEYFEKGAKLISPVFVGREYQGQGVATALLKKATDRYDIIALETQNDRNIPFYQKLGFKIIKSEYSDKYKLNNHYMLFQKQSIKE